MQVCLEGHVTTDQLIERPERGKPFCPKDGSRTMMDCENCKKPIAGKLHIPGVFALLLRCPHRSALRPHRPDDYITFKSPIAYDPAAQAPVFEHLLAEGDGRRDRDAAPAAAFYLLHALAGALEARTTQRRCFFLFGPKGTRKSTIIRQVQTVVRDFASDVSYRILSEARFEGDGQGPSPGTIKLRGRRLVVASEAKEHERLDTSLIKRLIGGDNITARGHHEAEQSFRFEATLMMTGNELPRIIADDGFWAKFKPIPFDNPLDDEDPEFEERELTPELPGILALLVRAHAELRAARYRMEDPPEVQALCTEEREGQPLADFVRECITKAPGMRVDVVVMRKVYAAFCKRTGMATVPGPRSLANCLRNEFAMEQGKSHDDRFWKDVELRGSAGLDDANW
jgi:putative DNA primase/helicase